MNKNALKKSLKETIRQSFIFIITVLAAIILVIMLILVLLGPPVVVLIFLRPIVINLSLTEQYFIVMLSIISWWGLILALIRFYDILKANYEKYLQEEKT